MREYISVSIAKVMNYFANEWIEAFFCLFCRKVLTLHRNWFTIIVMKRESGVNPEQSRCCNIPFLCKPLMPLDEKREV